MSRHALAEHRPWLLASLAASLAYYVVTRGWMPGAPMPELYLAILKGAGVGILAVFAWVRHPETDAKIIALVMALGALGDALLDLFFQVGAGFFLLGHLVACVFYVRHRRSSYRFSQVGAAFAILVMTPTVSWLLTRDPLVLLYSVGLGAMAATAWASRFSRYRVGLGAVLFVISDWLIFARLGIADAGLIADWLVWPIYYSGQFLIATGVIQTLRSDMADR
ncbi:lysoplasmalogenase [Parerythrobacter lacustris]|uniref:Lysoplasmalogenase n=1 Tax=Parerythrobacter lacustris TaxID=2969984 RepID=A0ABT1XT01_9SPHN|nr:lysoplasmalogenase [Parerythrobacter lacustris]MCR2833790.1 lysoplasmalogenase [Parerythrobacter lacustris]